MEEINISSSDVMHILKYGRLDGTRKEATPPGYYKYKMCSKTPESGNREICVVVICGLSLKKPSLKILSVSWRNLS